MFFLHRKNIGPTGVITKKVIETQIILNCRRKFQFMRKYCDMRTLLKYAKKTQQYVKYVTIAYSHKTDMRISDVI